MWKSQTKKIALSKFEKKEKELKKIENDIDKQKNILSEDELKKNLFNYIGGGIAMPLFLVNKNYKNQSRFIQTLVCNKNQK